MPKRILVVDDDPGLRAMLEAALVASGYSVSLAETGKRGLEAVADDRPDLIVMDVTMPEMTGFEALRALRQDPDTRLLPVLMLTGCDEHADRLEGWMGGAHLYLTKPCEIAAVVAAVEKLLSSAEKAPAVQPV